MDSISVLTRISHRPGPLPVLGSVLGFFSPLPDHLELNAEGIVHFLLILVFSHHREEKWA